MKRNTYNLAAFSHFRARAAGLRRGFTLVEVMVAIAIALALIVGISEIFAMAQKTTGGGTTLLKMNGTERSIQSQMRQDFQSINLDTTTVPGLVIVSDAAAAFRNKQDQLESRDPGLPPDPRNFNNPTSGDPPTMNTSVGQLPNGAYSTNGRIHRQDRLCMFVSNAFQRQTADAPNLTSQTATQEGFVWYGHLALLNDSGISTFNSDDTSTTIGQGSYMNPGVQSLPGQLKNDNNEYASSWILGRRAVPLVPSTTINSETAYRPFLHSETPLSMVGNAPSYSYPSPTGPTSTPSPIYSSRYDLSLSSSSECLTAYRNLTASDLPWFEQVSGLKSDLNTGDIITDVRYQANPFPTKPGPAAYRGNEGSFLSAAAALTAPVFVRGCTQFIVEFAGNYVTQNQDSTRTNNDFGLVTAAAADPSGKLDFIPIRDANGNWTRQIRWYGFPRDTAAVDPKSGIPAAGQDGQVLGTRGTNYITYDVVPVSMFCAAAGFPKVVFPFERNATAFQPFQTTFSSGGMSVGSSFPFRNINHTNPLLPMVSTPYICAWDSSVDSSYLPKLIRITIAIDEPNGRLNTEQTFEYIFELPN